MSKFFLLLALLFCTNAHADTIGLHVLSYHDKPGFNNANPGLYANVQGFTAGFYCNSESRSPLFPRAPACKVSTYVGYTVDIGPVSLTAGVITGYVRGTTPMLLPSVRLPAIIGIHPRIAVIPKIDPKRGANVVHLMLEKDF